MSFLRSSAIVVLDGRGILRENYGRWHTPDVPVCWASVTKLFVAALARMLVREGAVRPHEPLGPVLGVPVPPGITVAALVAHRSGLPRMPRGRLSEAADPYAHWTAERFDREILHRLADLQERPGRYLYSNLGYAVLGVVIEQVTGRAWVDVLRDRVASRWRLDVHGLAAGLPPQRLARCRTLRGRPLDDWRISGPFAAAGGLCAPVPVLAQLLEAGARPGGLLDPAETPNAWMRSGSLAWHDGATLRVGSLAALNTRTGAVVLSHTLGGSPGWGARAVRRAARSAFPPASGNRAGPPSQEARPAPTVTEAGS